MSFRCSLIVIVRTIRRCWNAPGPRMGNSMANKSADQAATISTRRTALAIVAVMAASGMTAGWFALSTVNRRRMRDLKPGAIDPLLGHITAETRFACGLSAKNLPEKAGRFQSLWKDAGDDPGTGPWCLVKDADGRSNLHHEAAAPLSPNPPFLARLVAGKRPERAVFWMASAGGHPDAVGKLASWGFPGAGDPAWVAEISRHGWLAWIEEQPGQWAGRMVVRPRTDGEAKNLDSFVQAGAPVTLRHQRNGGDVLLGWGLPPDR